jgi:hypothetical protein
VYAFTHARKNGNNKQKNGTLNRWLKTGIEKLGVYIPAIQKNDVLKSID